jgi:tetratricopeptide (TPR) repeat protein
MNDKSELPVSRTFVERFNEAAGLARQGRYEEALEAYDNIHAPFDDYTEERVMTGEFMGMIEIRKAYCLMDLERYDEAREIFESKLVKAAVGQFNKATLYDYFFSYGNTLGYLGDIKKMDSVMHKALAITMQELDDQEKLQDVWYWIMYWAKQHEKWAYLEEQCINAHRIGVRNKNIVLQVRAGEFGCYAYRGLGKIDKARRGAKIIIKRYKDAEADDNVIREWEDFLLSLDKEKEVEHG